ncbi:MAG: hypothetical protein JW727_02600 [Candidatus Aenigmarchaeota archaeon]|nr:hypothetical protein [Candidatus Aenigmarchaeota archaeon]
MPREKGQVNVYFLVSVAVFISLSIYLVFIMVSFYPSKAESIRINSLYGKAYSISEFLVKDEGYPEDWGEDSVTRLGISSVPYEINATKLAALNSLCSRSDPEHVERLLNSVGLYNEDVLISIAYLNGTYLLQCSAPGNEVNPESIKRRSALVSRISTFENEIVEVSIYVG